MFRERDSIFIAESPLAAAEAAQQALMKRPGAAAEQKHVERILAEVSGISDSSSAAAGFPEYERPGLCSKACLDSVVCVADADRVQTEFLENDDPEESIRARGFISFTIRVFLPAPAASFPVRTAGLRWR